MSELNSRFVTAARNSPEFNSYITGSFSKTHRALPVKSLNVGALNEEITFEIKLKSEIHRPHFFWLQPLLTKVSHFWFLAFPLIFVGIQILIEKNPAADIQSIGLLYITLAFGYFGMQLRNEVSDHIRGWDRAHPWAGSRSLQNGWATGQQLSRIANFSFLVSGLIGTYLFFKVSTELKIYVITTASLLAAMTILSENFQRKALGEILAFLFLGPLLITGLNWFIWDDPFKDLFFGIILGLWAWLALFGRNLQTQFFNSKTGLKNTVTLLGFEQSKNVFPYFMFSGIVTSFIWDYIHSLGHLQWLSFLYLVIVGIFGVLVSQKVLLSQGPFFSARRKEFSLMSAFFTLHYSVWLLIWMIRWILS